MAADGNFTAVQVNRTPGSMAGEIVSLSPLVARREEAGSQTAPSREEIPSVPLPRPRAPVIQTARASVLHVLQTWEGYVQEVRADDGVFIARLQDLQEGEADGREELAELALDDVDPDDLELVRPGAVFRWIIGHREHVKGKRERVSGLVFRRLPAWSAKELSMAQDQGRAVANAIQWE